MKKMIQSGLLAVRQAFDRRSQFALSRLLPIPICCMALCAVLALSGGALAQPAAAAGDAKAAQEKTDHDNALAHARRAIDRGEYDKAIELSTLVLQGWPGDPAAKELLARANMRKAVAATEPGTQPTPTTPLSAAPTQPVPTGAAAPPPTGMAAPLIPLAAPLKKEGNQDVTVSGDFFMGQGTISLPFGYSIERALGDSGLKQVALADRSSLYYGGTVSYTYGRKWYFDVSYAMGSSTGDPVILGLPSTFTLNDTLYQGYVRYTFPRLRGRRLSAYLRAGASFVQSDMQWQTVIPFFGIYEQANNSTDILGNLGFGVRYTIYTNRRLTIGLQGEGEGFYGTRSQESTENLPENYGYQKVPVTINNTLMGGIGRGTVRFDYRLGKASPFRIYGDVGFQAKFTVVNYPQGGGSANEMLWGPYAKLGLRYSF